MEPRVSNSSEESTTRSWWRWSDGRTGKRVWWIGVYTICFGLIPLAGNMLSKGVFDNQPFWHWEIIASWEIVAFGASLVGVIVVRSAVRSGVTRDTLAAIGFALMIFGLLPLVAGAMANTLLAGEVLPPFVGDAGVCVASVGLVFILAGFAVQIVVKRRAEANTAQTK